MQGKAGLKIRPTFSVAAAESENVPIDHKLTDPAPVVAPKAILFDLDGTLLDSFEAIQQSVNAVRRHCQLAPLTEPEVRQFVGHGLDHLMEQTVPAGERETYKRIYLEHHPTVMIAGTRVLPGVRATLEELQRRGYALGVCSNKPFSMTVPLLEGLGLSSFFRVQLGPESVARHKPAPDMLLAAMEQLAARPAETLYVGDMDIDVQTGRAAGVNVWVIPTGAQSLERLRSAQPDRILSQFAELLSWLAARPPR